MKTIEELTQELTAAAQKRLAAQIETARERTIWSLTSARHTLIRASRIISQIANIILNSNNHGTNTS